MRNSSLRDIKAELQQLAMDTRSSPQVAFSATMRKIRSRTSLLIRFLPANDSMMGKPIPVETEAGAMYRTTVSGVYDYQGLLPFRPHLSDNDPKQLIDSSKSGLWSAARQSQELLAKSQIFQ